MSSETPTRVPNIRTFAHDKERAREDDAPGTGRPQVARPGEGGGRISKSARAASSRKHTDRTQRGRKHSSQADDTAELLPIPEATDESRAAASADADTDAPTSHARRQPSTAEQPADTDETDDAAANPAPADADATDRDSHAIRESRSSENREASQTRTRPSRTKATRDTVSAPDTRDTHNADKATGDTARTNKRGVTDIPPFHDFNREAKLDAPEVTPVSSHATRSRAKTRSRTPTPRFDSDDNPDAEVATVITDTKRSGFNVFSAIKESVSNWFTNRHADKGTPEPEFTVPDAKKRKDLIQEATSKTGRGISADSRDLRERIRQRQRTVAPQQTGYTAADAAGEHVDQPHPVWTPGVESAYPLIPAPADDQAAPAATTDAAVADAKTSGEVEDAVHRNADSKTEIRNVHITPRTDRARSAPTRVADEESGAVNERTALLSELEAAANEPAELSGFEVAAEETASPTSPSPTPTPSPSPEPQQPEPAPAAKPASATPLTTPPAAGASFGASSPEFKFEGFVTSAPSLGSADAQQRSHQTSDRDDSAPTPAEPPARELAAAPAPDQPSAPPQTAPPSAVQGQTEETSQPGAAQPTTPAPGQPEPDAQPTRSPDTPDTDASRTTPPEPPTAATTAAQKTADTPAVVPAPETPETSATAPATPASDHSGFESAPAASPTSAEHPPITKSQADHPDEYAQRYQQDTDTNASAAPAVAPASAATNTPSTTTGAASAAASATPARAQSAFEAAAAAAATTPSEPATPPEPPPAPTPSANTTAATPAVSEAAPATAPDTATTAEPAPSAAPETPAPPAPDATSDTGAVPPSRTGAPAAAYSRETPLPGPDIVESVRQRDTNALAVLILAGIALIITLALGGYALFNFLYGQLEGEQATDPSNGQLATTHVTSPLTRYESGAVVSDMAAVFSEPADPLYEVIFTDPETGAPIAPRELVRVFTLPLTADFAASVTGFTVALRQQTYPALILSVDNVEAARGGLLTWEATMAFDVLDLLGQGISAREPLASARFTDGQVAGYDVRYVTDENGSVRLLYGFVDENTLVITTDERTFQTLAPLAE